jgi:hypothetical protein
MDGAVHTATFTLHVYAHTDRLYRLKLVVIPALLAVAALSFIWFGAELGCGYPAGLPERFEYVTHRLVLENDRKGLARRARGQPQAARTRCAAAPAAVVQAVGRPRTKPAGSRGV